MKTSSFKDSLDFNENHVVTKMILESSFSKEIRVLMKKGQEMKEHKTPYPIVVHLLEGSINFDVNGELYILEKGNILTLEGNIPHSLFANENSVVRLTLSKSDSAERVQKVTNQ